MQLELRNFLDAIKLDKIYYHEFDEVEILKVCADENQVFHIYLKSNNIFDIGTYNKLVFASKNFTFPVKFHIQVVYKVNELAIASYYFYLVNSSFKNHPLFNDIKKLKPKLVGETIRFEVEDEDYAKIKAVKEEIEACLKDVGISYPVEVVKPIVQEEIVSSLPIEEEKVVEEEKEVIQEENKLSPLFDYHREQKDVEMTVTVYEIDSRDIRVSEAKSIKEYKFICGDDYDSIVLKVRESDAVPRIFLDGIKEGSYIHVKGDVRFDRRENDYTFYGKEVEKAKKVIPCLDNEEVKRVELHLHSQMSTMDAVTNIADYIETAAAWGHKAIALTDHGGIQAFPEAQKAAKKAGIKMIYGMEGYVVDEELRPTMNDADIDLLNTTYVVFDFETTGLSARHDDIIEFGAVKMRHGLIVDKFQVFVNPMKKLPAFIVEKTNITDEMLRNYGTTLQSALPQIRKFIEGCVLVAHNARFDVGFLNAAYKKLGYQPLTNPVIDTLDLSKMIMPEVKAFSLGAIARRLNVQYDDEIAHRADYDAEVLSEVFNSMLNTLDVEYDIRNHKDIKNIEVKDAYKKNFPFHVTFLVKDMVGLKNLYNLVTLSHIDYITKYPLIPRRFIEQYREGLLIGSSCFNGEIFEMAQSKSEDELNKAVEFYDYIEVQPYSCYSYLLDTDRIISEERLQNILNDIVNAGKKMNKLVVATGDVHYLRPKDKIFRDIYIHAKAKGGVLHPLHDRKHRVKSNPDQHFRTTKEMLDDLSYIQDEALKYELVVTNTNKIADMITEEVVPIQDELFTPKLPGIDAQEEIERICRETAAKMYGLPLPKIVEERMEKELGKIRTHKFGVIYYLAHRLVNKSKSDGYLVGSRGSVGSSFVATLSGITEVNPLAPHYRCPKCHHNEFFLDGSVKSGFDLDPKLCPECGEMMIADGQNIPFETFLGINGDKVPDIDLNFSRDYQWRAHNYTKELLGEYNVFRAGTVSTVATKTAKGYIRGYWEEVENRNEFRETELARFAYHCQGVKRTTGQHPGGIIVVPSYKEVHDFTPVQYPADSDDATWKTTHYPFSAIHDEILKLDILGHVDPNALRMLQDLTGINPEDIPMNDKKVLSLFTSTQALGVEPNDIHNDTGTSGIPEFGTNFVKGILKDYKPTKVSDLIQISGLSHGTDVWRGNAQDLIVNGTCTSEEVIGCRDDIMTYLELKGLDSTKAFKIMESVRKGKGLSAEFEAEMREHNVPDWYIASCKLIKYMFPKAHATAYVVMALRIAWYKVYRPLEYYATYFTTRCDKYDIDTMIKGKSAIMTKYLYILQKNPRELKPKEKDIQDVLEMALEMTARGFTFSNVSITKSDATKFIVDLENNALIPPFMVIDGLGDAVAQSIIDARNEKPFISKQDLLNRTQISTTHFQIFDKMGMLDEMANEEQMTLSLF